MNLQKSVCGQFDIIAVGIRAIIDALFWVCGPKGIQGFRTFLFVMVYANDLFRLNNAYFDLEVSVGTRVDLFLSRRFKIIRLLIAAKPILPDS